MTDATFAISGDPTPVDQGGTQLDPAIAEAFAALCRERSGAWPIAHGTTDVD